MSFAASAAILTFSSTVASAQIVLSYSPWNAPTYVVNEAIYPWFDKVAEVTEGRVVVEPRAAAVGTPAQQAEMVRDGLVDVSLIIPGYSPGRFPLLELGELGLTSDEIAKSAPAMATIYEKYFEEIGVFDGAHALSVFNVAPAQLATRDRPVVDGAVFPYEPTVSFGLQDVFKFFTDVPGGLGQAGTALLVNQEKWDTISPEDQEAIMAISGAVLARQVGEAVDAGAARSKQILEDGGATIETASPELIAALEEQLEPVYAAWVEKAKTAGLENAEEVLAEYREMVK